jgi:hypothetical protein
VKNLLPILLLFVAGIMAGGVVSLRKQGAPLPAVLTVGVIAALAGIGGVLWLVPK